MKKKINKYVFVSYIVQGINAGVNFLYSFILVYLLGASGFGEYAIFNNSLTFAVLVFGFNIPSIIIFFITNQRINAGRLLFSSLLCIIIVSGILIIILAQSYQWEFSMHIFPGGNNRSIWIFFFVGQFFLLQTNQVLAAFLNAHKIFIPISVFSLIINVVLIFFWILFASGKLGLNVSVFDLVWVVNIILNLSILIYSFFLLFTRIRDRLSFSFIAFSDLKLLSGFAVIVYLCNVIQFLNYKMDVWFINYFINETDTGIYALTLSLSQLIWILPNAISSVLLNYYQVDKKEHSIQFALYYGSLSFYFSLVIALILSIVYYFALPILYGVQFDRAFILCLLLFAGTVPFSLAIIIANLNSGIGFIRINLYITILTFLAGIALDYILIPAYGIKGAVIAKIVIYIGGSICQIVAGNLLYKLPWRKLFAIPDFKKLRHPNLVN